MANPQVIRPVVAGTPPELAVTRSHFRPLPYDLLKEASNRLGILCLLAAALWEREANAAPVAGLEEQMMLAGYIADLRRFQGDPEAAWRSKSKTIGAVINGIPEGELLAFKRYYDKLYGESPEYRAYMTKIAEEAPP